MLRDKNLIPLSHQHQRALALCVRIDRAHPIAESDLEAWQQELANLFEQEIELHFLAEENVVFKAAESFPELLPLVEELKSDHCQLRETFSLARSRRLSADSLAALAQGLSVHIRKEERNLFECMQRLLSSQQLASVGKDLESALKDAVKICALPSTATELRPKRDSGS
jgi:hemerythrin-like domain-containing protein